MKLIKTIPEYYHEIHLPPPKYPFFHVGRHEANRQTIRQQQPPIRHELYSISITNIRTNLNINFATVHRLFIISPFNVISWNVVGQTIEGMYIIFDKTFIQSHILWSDFLTDFPYFRFTKQLTDQLPERVLSEIYEYFQKIEMLYYGPEADAFEIIKAYVHLILLLLKKHLINLPETLPAGVPFGHQLLADFESALVQAVGDPQTHPDFRQPSYYASILHVHVNHLNAVMRQMTGKTTSDLIQSHLIQQASVLLQDPNQTLKAVAAHFQFTAPTHFIAFFRKYTGLTPRQYQARKST